MVLSLGQMAPPLLVTHWDNQQLHNRSQNSISCRKRMIMAVSGQVGLGQLYCDRVEGLWKANKLGRDITLPDVQRLLQEAIFQDAQLAMARAASTVPLVGNAVALALASSASLVALPVGGINGHPELIQCNHVGSTEAATEDLPYVAIGSGQHLADPFLAFLRRLFWGGTTPRLAQGVFAVVWTLTHAIKVTPGGVSEPIQLATLTKEKGNELSARLLTPEELQEHQQSVTEAESYLASFGETS